MFLVIRYTSQSFLQWSLQYYTAVWIRPSSSTPCLAELRLRLWLRQADATDGRVAEDHLGRWSRCQSLPVKNTKNGDMDLWLCPGNAYDTGDLRRFWRVKHGETSWHVRNQSDVSSGGGSSCHEFHPFLGSVEHPWPRGSNTGQTCHAAVAMSS